VGKNMASLTSLADVWKNVKEVDLRPIRQEALRVISISLVGAQGTGKQALAEQMRNDPAHADVESFTPIPVLNLNEAQKAYEADLIVLLVRAGAPDFKAEKDLVRFWKDSGKKVLVFVQTDLNSTADLVPAPVINWGQERVVYGSVESIDDLSTKFVPAVMDLVPEQLVSLGRHFPLFRIAIANKLINETCFSNAAYSISTGLAEIVPVFDIPLNVADMIVLTKAQAFLVYRLGLALGLSTQWQDYVTEFGGVLGGGFVWRQVARSLVGLIPAWGIIPKVAVAYAGTYVVGHTILQWYLTGRQLSKDQMRQLYNQAFDRGKDVARNLLSKAPRPRRPRIFRRRKKKALPASSERICPHCGRINSPDAKYCQYCGQELVPASENDSDDG
jgi:uncharacterized protein (DUF697 family)